MSQPARILVVDDDPVLRLLLCNVLRLNGYQVEAVDNGRQALDALQQQGYDLVISDLLMPEMDGQRLIEAMQARPQMAAIPVLIFTAYEAPQLKQQLMAMGVADVLPKPLRSELLLSRVGALLSSTDAADRQ